MTTKDETTAPAKPQTRLVVKILALVTVTLFTFYLAHYAVVIFRAMAILKGGH